LLKGWTVTLIAALFALAANDTNKGYIVVAYFPLFIFWFLDGYFLSMERRFRSLYEHVRQLKEEDIDFLMSTEPYKSDLRNQWISTLFSRTLFPYYATLALLLISSCIRRLRPLQITEFPDKSVLTKEIWLANFSSASGMTMVRSMSLAGTTSGHGSKPLRRSRGDDLIDDGSLQGQKPE
jgi:hypothetical protein